jgi:hypothetical protein
VGGKSIPRYTASAGSIAVAVSKINEQREMRLRLRLRLSHFNVGERDAARLGRRRSGKLCSVVVIDRSAHFSAVEKLLILAERSGAISFGARKKTFGSYCVAEQGSKRELLNWLSLILRP